MKSVRLSRLEPLAFLVFAAACTVLSARSFFDARQSALLFAEAARGAAPDGTTAHLVPPVPWSAPLDDVFIHFDFARSLAHGRFFEWAPGGGYSSGATSWLYPALLAVAYRMGFTGFALGRFADWFACVCVFGGLLALRRAYAPVYRGITYLFAAALLSLGVFAWTLWSGMELALFFLIWSCAHALFRHLRSLEPPARLEPLALGLGIAGVLLVATRPESVVCLGIWFGFLWADHLKVRGKIEVAKLALRVLAPAVALVAFRSILNRVLTGEFADAGSLVKLELLAPFYDVVEVVTRWGANVGFQFGRITAYHAGDSAPWGTLLWFLVIAALWQKSTRREAKSLVAMALAWMALVANNEYVRYQNDRYTMPPLAWLVMTATLGVWGLFHQTRDHVTPAHHRWKRWMPGVVALGAVAIWTWHQSARLRQQQWLFGRACRNIAEQQVRLGMLLQLAPDAANRRILVGDAGAIEYFSYLPGVDAIGLGGTRGLPFARAVRLGNGAIVELLERMPPQQRPDLLALYPSWWKELPLWFGAPVLELPINGNVICGAPNKVVYDADWRGLETDSIPSKLDPGWHTVDELDIADLVSESEHDYSLSHRHSGYVLMKILPHLADPSRDLFDAGRILFARQRATFEMTGLAPGRPLRMLFRAAPADWMRCKVTFDGQEIGVVKLPSKDAWQESSLDVRPGLVKTTGKVVVTAEHGECNLFHIWALQPDI